MLEEILKSGLDQMKITYDNRTIERFRKYYEILTERNKVMNLTSIEGEEETARLHFLDCAAVVSYIGEGSEKVLDIGTGAGFPGIVIKILRPDIELTLVDSLDKRINFLKDVCEELEFDNVNCIHARAEELSEDFRQSFDVVTTRAVARLNVLCEICMPWVTQGGKYLSMKGPDCEDEVSEAEKAVHSLGGNKYKISKYQIPGTDIYHGIVEIQKNGITSEKYPRKWAQIKKNPIR